MEPLWAQNGSMTPPCPPSSPRQGLQSSIGEIEPSVALTCDLISLAPELEKISLLDRAECAFASRQRHRPPTSPVTSRNDPGHDFDSYNRLPQPSDDDTTVYGASSPATSRSSNADTILEHPTRYRNTLRDWKLGEHRTSARSYHELWPSSPASLVHTMPTAFSSARQTSPLPHPFPPSRRPRPSRPHPRGSLTANHISPPILHASTVVIGATESAVPLPSHHHPPASSASASPTRTRSWSGLMPYCPHRQVPPIPPPAPKGEREQSGFDAYSDDEDGYGEEGRDGDDVDDDAEESARGRGAMGRRLGRGFSSGFRRLLCRCGSENC